jgi:DeoR/GlpR family transcriptional regulator of sugar metabolism
VTSQASSPNDDDLALAEYVWEDLPRSGTILLGTGRLTIALAEVMAANPPAQRGLTVATNSLDAAVRLSRVATLAVYNIGGTVSPTSHAQEGEWALQELSRVMVDVSVVVPAGISVERGLSQASPAAAAISQVEVACGRRVLALADADTLGRPSFVRFADVHQIHQLAVAGDPGHAALQPFLDRGVAVSVAGTHLPSGSDRSPETARQDRAQHAVAPPS